LALYQRGEAVEDWIGRADAALYQAKQGGRNAFIIAPWQATSAPSPAPARR
jgi:PleD family two-component response regulator